MIGRQLNLFFAALASPLDPLPASFPEWAASAVRETLTACNAPNAPDSHVRAVVVVSNDVDDYAYDDSDTDSDALDDDTVLDDDITTEPEPRDEYGPFTLEEVAEAIGTGRENVKRITTRALAKMRRRLELLEQRPMDRERLLKQWGERK